MRGDEPRTGSWAGPGDRVPLLRDITDQSVLDVIFREGPSTRPALAKATGLSKPTVSEAIRRLVDTGLLVEAGEDRQAGRPGRVPRLYAIHPMAAHVVAVDVGGVNARAAVVDIYGNLVAEHHEPSASAGGRISRQLARLVDTALEKASVSASAVLDVAVSTPGVVDPVSQRVRLAYNLGIGDDFDLVADLRTRDIAPVLVENNVNLAALGERWRGLAREHPTFAYVAVGAGIGLGLVYDDELLRGSHGAAGEISYLPLTSDPFDPRHRTRGGLEDEVGASALLDGVRDTADWPAPRPTSVEELFDQAAEGVTVAEALVDTLGRRVGLAIASISAVIDPGLVVLGGGIGANPVMCDVVGGVVSDLLPFPPTVQTSVLGSKAPLYGAAYIAVVAARERLVSGEATPGRERQTPRPLS